MKPRMQLAATGAWWCKWFFSYEDVGNFYWKGADSKNRIYMRLGGEGREQLELFSFRFFPRGRQARAAVAAAE